MAIDLEKVKNKLKGLESKNDKTNYTWKPEPGKQVIRIVPYIHNPDFPFIELFFNYEVSGGKSIVSPISWGRKDPVMEFATKLKSTGNSDDYKLGKKIEPKERFYAAIIVRGEESEGVKFWGFGKTVYAELLKFISDADYGDITDLQTGRDITVEFKTKAESSTNFPQTDIRIKPNQSVVGDEKILPFIQNQKKIEEIFEEPSYQELDDMLQKYLNPDESDDTENQSEKSTTKENNNTPENTHTAKSAEDLNEKFKALFKK